MTKLNKPDLHWSIASSRDFPQKSNKCVFQFVVIEVFEFRKFVQRTKNSLRRKRPTEKIIYAEIRSEQKFRSAENKFSKN